MGNYSDDSASVRVDFFKPSGKWYTTEAVVWTGSYDGLIGDAFAETLRDHLRRGTEYRLSDMTAVCLEPYHEHAHPLMMTVEHAINYEQHQAEMRAKIASSRARNT